MEETADWQPLLTGASADAAWQAVEAIAADLSADAGWSPEAEGGLTPEQQTSWEASLAAGAAGQALFFAYLSAHHERHGEAGRAADLSALALERLDRAFEGVATVPMSESFYAGFPGVAWVAAHLEGRLFSDEDDGNAEVDAALLPSLSHVPWRGEYDLMHGLAGLGVYALERLPIESGARCLEAVVDRLAERATPVPGGMAWFSPPESLPEYQRELFPDGMYNLGASHGAPGVAAFLGAAAAAGADRARPLLREVFAWLETRRARDAPDWHFPHFYHPDIQQLGSRVAWCYGDPGVAAALLVAARGAGEPAWEELALAVGRTAASRRDDKAGVRDAGLCHGAGGLGHLFQRMAQTSGDPQLADAARFWLERALELRRPGLGIGGYRSWASGAGETQDWRDDAGFLEGAAGVGLALLGAVSPVDPEWDRAFLMSLRRR
jgi:lantibiotic modifying enzyme